MRTTINLVIIFMLAACSKNEFNDIPENNIMDTSDSLISITGLSLYWDHEIFGKEGRRIRFEFYNTTQYRNYYEFDFNYTIDADKISVNLVDVVNSGKCGVFPTVFGMDSLCHSKGSFYIPDTLLSKGIYQFELHTDSFSVLCDFMVTDSSYQLKIPDNRYFSCEIHNVFPIQKDIIMGGIVFAGKENIAVANLFKDELIKSGLQETTVRDYPYRHLYVNDDGTPVDDTWPPENYAFGLLYRSGKVSFKDIVAVAENAYLNSDLNIYLYSGMGDEARFSQTEGIHIVYTGE